MTKRSIYTIMLLIALTSCNTNRVNTDTENNFCNNDSIRKDFRKNLAYPKNEQDYPKYLEFNYRYYEKKKLPDDCNQWISYHLFGLEECPLNPELRDQYRFLMLPSFSNPICINLIKNRNNTVLNVKVCDGYGGYHCGKLIEDVTVELNDSIWKNFEKIVNYNSFWNFSPYLETNGGDGTYYVIESVKTNGRHHIVVRWSPEYNKEESAKKIGVICNYLLWIAKKHTKVKL